MIAAFICAALLIEESSVQAARNELLCHHPKGALEVVERGLLEQPSSKALWDQKIYALSEIGDKKALLSALETYERIFESDPAVLEKICWSLIRNGAERRAPTIRMRAVYIAALTNDAHSIELILKGLSDEQLSCRLFAIYLASHFLDEPIQKRLQELFEQDRSPEARLSACQGLHLTSALPSLRKKLMEAESEAFIECIIHQILTLTKKIDREEIAALVQSNKPALRELAPKLVLEHFSRDDLDLIMPLICDPSERVKIACLNTLGAFHQETCENVRGFLDKPSSSLQSAALLYLIRMGHIDEQVETKLRQLLQSSHRDIRLEATSALISSGKEGAGLSQKFMTETDDPLVAINLAVHLIKERSGTQKAASTLSSSLPKISERLSFDGDLIVASKTVHMPHMPRYPETVDLITRLQLSCILATCSDAHLGSILRDFLKEKNASIVGLSAALFIQENDESGIEEIRTLLQDPSFEIRTEAAIILGLMAQDEEALKTLYEAFEKVTPELQEEILFAIGAIGAPSSLPFLVKCLYQARETLQLAAAGSILQCQNK